MANTDNSEKWQISKLLEGRMATLWAFAIGVSMILVPFFNLRNSVQVMDRKIEHYNTISSNHLSEIEADIKALRKDNERNRQNLEQVSEDIAELKALIQETH